MKNELNKLSVFGDANEASIMVHTHISRQDVESAKKRIADKCC